MPFNTEQCYENGQTVSQRSKPGGAASQGVSLVEFLLPLTVALYDENAAPLYGDLRWMFEKSGKTLGSLDMMIAAHALSLGVALVTNNMKQFQRVPGLPVENWVQLNA